MTAYDDLRARMLDLADCDPYDAEPRELLRKSAAFLIEITRDTDTIADVAAARRQPASTLLSKVSGLSLPTAAADRAPIAGRIRCLNV